MLELQLQILAIIEKAAFNFNSNNKPLLLSFILLNLSGDSFEVGSFDGNQRQLKIQFKLTDITYIPESSFKSVLNKNENVIKFDSKSTIDCEDCRNQWLINNQMEKQIKNATCKSEEKKTLFDQDIQLKLKNKCK